MLTFLTKIFDFTFFLQTCFSVKKGKLKVWRKRPETCRETLFAELKAAAAAADEPGRVLHLPAVVSLRILDLEDFRILVYCKCAVESDVHQAASQPGSVCIVCPVTVTTAQLTLVLSKLHYLHLRSVNISHVLRVSSGR